MRTPSKIESNLSHRPSGRSAALIRAANLSSAALALVRQGKYVLFMASEKSCASQLTTETARAWIEAGTAYVCAWGPGSPDCEEAFDYAAFLPELGGPLSFTLMTTSHAGESLEEALWFAFHSAMPPDDLGDSLQTVVLVVDSMALESRCLAWVRGRMG